MCRLALARGGGFWGKAHQGGSSEHDDYSDLADHGRSVLPQASISMAARDGTMVGR